MASGEIVAAYAWNESYVKLKQQGVPVGFMVPKENHLHLVLRPHPQFEDQERGYGL